jgi:Zn-dependent protease with chaperone function
MNRVEYLQLLRSCEHAAAAEPQRYRRAVVWFSMLGFGYALLVFAIGLGLVAFAMYASLSNVPRLLWGLSGLALIGSAFMALRLKFEPPTGFEISPSDAPELFKALAKMQKKLRAPAVDRVLLTDDFNAFVVQESQLSFLGAGKRTMAIGIPLILNVNTPRLLGVLAHEYAHLRGKDAAFSAWLYRARRAWQSLAEDAFSKDSSSDELMSWITRGFAGWYAPRFFARSFALARQEEYTADRWAAKMVGKDVMGHALVEIALRSKMHAYDFWRRYWQTAAHHPRPEKMPLAWAAAGGMGVPQAQHVQRSFAQIRAEKATHDDTHPTTRERAQALGQKLELPPPSITNAAFLFGKALDAAIDHFDKKWWLHQRKMWELSHAAAQLDLAQFERLRAAQRHLSADELVEMAALQDQLFPQQSAEQIYMMAVQKDDRNAVARWGLVRHLADRNDPLALQNLSLIESTYPHYAFAASSLALRCIAALPRTPELHNEHTAWKARLSRAQDAEDEYCEKFWETAPLDNTSPHDLKPREMRALHLSLTHAGNVEQAWVLSKNPRGVMPHRRAYLLVIAAPVDDSTWPELGAAIMRSAELPGPLRLALIEDLQPTQRQKLGPPSFTPKDFNELLRQHLRAPA